MFLASIVHATFDSKKSKRERKDRTIAAIKIKANAEEESKDGGKNINIY